MADPTAPARFDPRAYREPAPAPWLIHALGPVNRHLMLRGMLRLADFRLPTADLARLRGAVNPGTAAFLGPNHPEFMTDWLIDKEISRLASPLMAHWASYEIVNVSPLGQRFWLANNLIANAPGGGGKEYSIRWALAGHGVLLHPEGTATWQGERVAALLPGIVDLACAASERAAAAGSRRPVFVVPLLWALHFTGDAGPGLAREITHIERALALPASRGALEDRFATLLVSLLARQCVRLALPAPPLQGPAPACAYFGAQAATIAAIRERLSARHGPVDPDIVRAQHQLRGSIRARAEHDPEGARLDRRLLAELQRLHGCDPRLYDRPTITQEQLAENLKRIRTSLVSRGLGNALHNTLPVAVAPRIAHVRVPPPLSVPAPGAGGEPPGAARARLLDELRSRMQGTLDTLRAELAPVMERHRRDNPLYSAGA